MSSSASWAIPHRDERRAYMADASSSLKYTSVRLHVFRVNASESCAIMERMSFGSTRICSLISTGVFLWFMLMQPIRFMEEALSRGHLEMPG